MCKKQFDDKNKFSDHLRHRQQDLCRDLMNIPTQDWTKQVIRRVYSNKKLLQKEKNHKISEVEVVKSSFSENSSSADMFTLQTDQEVSAGVSAKDEVVNF